MSLCSASIQCHIDYACSAWYSGLSKCLNKNYRFVRTKWLDSFVATLPGILLIILFLVLLICCVFNSWRPGETITSQSCFNIYNNKAPSYLKSNFRLKTSNLGRQTRSCTNLDFNIPRVNTCESSTFYFNGIRAPFVWAAFNNVAARWDSSSSIERNLLEASLAKIAPVAKEFYSLSSAVYKRPYPIYLRYLRK